MDDGRPAEFLKLDIDPEKYKQPFKRVKVSAAIEKLIREIQRERPEWGPERIAAHARLIRGVSEVTVDHVHSVFNPEK